MYVFSSAIKGLVTAEDFRKARELVSDDITEGEKRQREREEEASSKRKNERALKRKKMASSLSFAMDDDDNVEEVNTSAGTLSTTTARNSKIRRQAYHTA